MKKPEIGIKKIDFTVKPTPLGEGSALQHKWIPEEEKFTGRWYDVQITELRDVANRVIEMRKCPKNDQTLDEWLEVTKLFRNRANPDDIIELLDKLDRYEDAVEYVLGELSDLCRAYSNLISGSVTKITNEADRIISGEERSDE